MATYTYVRVHCSCSVTACLGVWFSGRVYLEYKPQCHFNCLKFVLKLRLILRQIRYSILRKRHTNKYFHMDTFIVQYTVCMVISKEHNVHVIDNLIIIFFKFLFSQGMSHCSRICKKESYLHFDLHMQHTTYVVHL